MVVSKKMEKEAMRCLVDYFNAIAGNPNRYIDKSFFEYKGICKENEANHLIQYLEHKELIKYSWSDYHRADCIQLLPGGECYFEAKRDNRNKRLFEVGRFILEIIKDIAIFLAGVWVEGKFDIIKSLFGS